MDPSPMNLMQSSTSSSEVVYGGTNSLAGSEESRVMSEKVQMLASSIYKEFEAMIQKHGQDSVKDLMPLVVNVLENLDLAYLEKEEHMVDLEMLKEENEQVLNQFERERQMRKTQDQKCIEMEENLMEQNRELEEKIQSLESIVRMLELKSKNAQDHANRLEEREADQKMEYEKLHERYNDLLRTHIEHVERTKFLMGAEMFDMAQSLPMNVKNRNNMAMSVVDTNVRGISDLISAVHMSQSTHADVNLANHISSERDWQEEFGTQTAAEILQSPREENVAAKREETEAEEKAESQAKDEAIGGDRLNVQKDEDAISLGADLTGMGREVENLIRENTELLETKNALNIVKNDLIARVDELSSEHGIFREEIRSLEMVKMKMSDRIRELEADIKELKEKKSQEESSEEQEDVPMAQRKRFTRVEMARVLMERNQYKEKLIELQDALKFTEMQRAKKISAQPQGKTGIWDFFSNLFGDGSSQTRPSSQQSHRKVNKRTEGSSRKVINRNFDVDVDSVQEKRMTERRQQYKAVSQHMKTEDDSRTQAYGWSIPATVDTATATASIPVPVCCRPLLDRQPSLKIWCAASVALYGGRTKDGTFVVGDPLLGCDPSILNSANEALLKNGDWSLNESSSLIWVCSSNERRSFVTILDANNPNNILECFAVCSSHLLCIASVAGVLDSEIRPDEDFRSKLPCDSGYLKDVPSDIGDVESLGAVTYVELRKMEADDGVPTYCAAESKPPSPKRTRDFSVNGAADGGTEDETATTLRDGKPQKRVTFSEEGASTIEVANEENDPEDPEQHKEVEKSASSAAPGAPVSTLRGNIPLHIRETLSRYEQLGEKSTALPTMWMGLENEFIHIHSAVVEWKTCLMRLKMPDAVLHILHLNGRVFAALANGSIAVFHRDADGNWSDSGYNLIQLGKATNSVCHLTNVCGKIWAAYRNCVVIVNPDSLKIEHVFVAHPRKDSQVRHMVSADQGVWLSIRLDSTIRLYHSSTYQHLQDVDIEPYITKMLGTNKLDFLHLRITSITVLNKKLWIGTGTGVILLVPLSEENSAKVDVSRGDTSTRSKKDEPQGPGGLIRVYGGSSTQSGEKSSASTVPYCNMTQAQLSFHGHKDAVRFFLPVLSDGISDLTHTLETKKLLMISGGDGYIDFRLGEDEDSIPAKEQVRVRDMSHLIVWEIECPNTRPSSNKSDAKRTEAS
ncbi:JNKSAPK-associated protein-1 domain-containing protein [Ditylenchus destructor]|uniref:JNKSAPK-associated protein-1 domain-containing protein n=1 Tax=Ditylenchus destructor TaxID=166010 RepID=A0AAD4NH91_9BILA|nr:JNKSAPK-associated protein-1 domain-containing protein [Ditylenchus destructor]